MSNEALEASGRAFVERTLSRLIVLQQDERLVLAATSRRTEGGVAPGGERAYSAVVANRVVFSREIGGIPVVGAGSKVTVTFLNDGAVASFRYDWPMYTHTGRVQAMAAPIEVLHRLQRVSGVRTKTEADRALEAPPNLEIDHWAHQARRQRRTAGYEMRLLRSWIRSSGPGRADPGRLLLSFARNPRRRRVRNHCRLFGRGSRSSLV